MNAESVTTSDQCQFCGILKTFDCFKKYIRFFFFFFTFVQQKYPVDHDQRLIPAGARSHLAGFLSRSNKLS